MKTTLSPITKFIPLLIITAFYFSSCASKTVPFVASTIVPGAEGEVKVKKDNNNNYLIDLDIEHLAPSTSLTPSKAAYVAWMETNENGTKNIGQVTISKSRKASLSTASTFKPVKIFISAEDDGKTEIPGNTIVLTTEPLQIKK